MGYRLVADTAMILHAAFLVYMVVGGFLAWRWRWTFWPHLATAAYGLGIATVGWVCPLTHVENWGRARAGEETLPSSGFIDHYLTDVIYPAEHLWTAHVAVATAVLVSWAGLAYLQWRARARSDSPASEVRQT
ncbi:MULTISPECIES: DUF2784 domain-containing protein [unclassified Dietzia]|uniref:DUF2784 domain-containing protein n=1 Tax=unclassified Dietzia TaxID=2617939 RepID=UPI000D219F2E|nr:MULTISPECIES: DUF2784 domain-containing protein [unclassified Dietzia]AVZ39826.1 DUF2784 domain-containing protein [Dietzia sp. JS16-p6b]MBB1023957.1 DUF2784 domain-containing protein [Dietzia sp. DQ12-76]MBB1027313.1 DUF2784 domain-containing protein [Dietzia sp. DQ11-38-2]QGW25187.1 hypothetical protein GJR88_03334 [Dietzia sp. DQ12-45-1b]